MDDVMESGNLGPFQERASRVFPSMRTKPYTPLMFHVLMRINVRVLFVLLLLGLGGIFYAGASTSPIIVFVLSVCISSFVFSMYLTKWVLSKDEGPPEMVQISDAIRDGAEGFFRTQYGTISKMALLLAFIILCIYLFRSTTPQQEFSGLGRSVSAYITVASFLLGALCSGIAGYVGMWVSVRANVRVSSAARRSAREALQIAVRAGGFSAMVVVGMAVIGVAVLYATFYVWLGVDSPGAIKVTDLPLLLVGYGFGASFVALFAQLGGGIYTKAADVGADLVGKVEQGIPEDDPRNPAVIADLVGDNVGDCAARGADLFESIAAEIISAMILGGAMAQKCKIEDPSGFILFPLVVHSFDLVVSSIGILSIRSKRDSGVISVMEDPMAILQKGYSVTIVFAVITFGLSTRWMLYTEQAPSAWLNFALCGLVGIMTAYIFVWITKFYTDYKHEPVRTLALSSSTGHGTNIIAGVSLGLESTALPVIVISVSIISAFWLGHTSGLVDEAGNPTGGLFGTAVATMGMLSTAAYVLTMDMFGPIADNAGGIVEMSQQPESVREITDILDAVGNTTKATTKGFAIGSAALASFLLFSAYMDEVSAFAHEPFNQVDIAIPEVFVGGLLGSMLIFLFSAWACSAVGRTAQEVVNEVRRQFIERPGIMDYREKPDYGRCVSIVASASLREMIKPGALAIVSPILIGLVFRILGHYTGHPLLGAKVVASMLMFATVSGILMALFLNTAGGAWDNAKKYIETGALGGKGSESHKAAVTGDTVGDPFKDTAGPSLHEEDNAVVLAPKPANSRTDDSKISLARRKLPSNRSSNVPDQAPELSSKLDGRPTTIPADSQFEERLRAVKKSAVEQKKAEEEKLYGAIDYDAPIEPESGKQGLATKIGVAVAAVIFGLVFAFGDFLPTDSDSPTEEAAPAGSKISSEERERLQKRLQQFEQTLSISTEDTEALEGTAVTLAELGEYGRAASRLEDLIKKKPTDPDVFRLLGEVKYELKDFDGSAAAYRTAMMVSKSLDFEVLSGITNALLAAKKPAEAVQVLLSVREQQDGDKPVLSENNSERSPNGESSQVDPVQVDLLLGKAYSDWGHVSDAIAIYDQLISHYPNDFRAYLAKGIILKENGNIGGAERMFIQARFYAPDKARALVDKYSK
ncbi:OLC1v1015341C1 [Oldenlandia corymbosa var. corymbosa]|uniref:H(+)-exporting diphosphatase n=1 Tax=Oldenlandia corymbosa var. corymbosa TaxID=529605 RepID=A0AAV1E583_OLDCO|nr:OLC1v1015341C1 [Oldenlandia corymbosa var. corymbosa]